MERKEFVSKMTTSIKQNPVDFVIFSALRERQPLRISELATETGYSKTWMSMRVNALAVDRLVTLKPDVDQRATLVRLNLFPELLDDEKLLDELKFGVRSPRGPRRPIEKGIPLSSVVEPKVALREILTNELKRGGEMSYDQLVGKLVVTPLFTLQASGRVKGRVDSKGRPLFSLSEERRKA